MENSQEALTQDVKTLLIALRQSGVRKVVLSTGSRSTPIAILLGRLQDKGAISLYVDVDERSAGFFALGMAKVHAEPVLLVCTSGTAAANYYPAICEAFASKVPLIILTADRPPELQEIGAPQTMNQNDMYGHQVKQSYQLPLPETDSQLTQRAYIAYIVQKAVSEARDHPAGPVHLNWPLRKPLMPILTPTEPSKTRLITPVKPTPTFDEATRRYLTTLFSGKKGLIVAGPANHYSAKDCEAVIAFARQMKWVVIADPLSGLRGYPGVISSGDWLFRVLPKLPAVLQPEVILRMGGTLVSAAVLKWLAVGSTPIVYLDADYQWRDATLCTTTVIPASAADLLPLLQAKPAKEAWVKKWHKLDQQIVAAIQTDLAAPLTTGSIAAALSNRLPADAAIFVSNSMPIREMDDYFSPRKPGIRVFCNRGVNGIDGVNSTALGMAAGRHANYLYIGDLAFFHDLTGLMMAKQYHLDLTVVIQNNNGGGIFSLLPQAAEKGQFEKVFGTPLNLNIKAIADLYGATYQRITNIDELNRGLREPQPGLTLLEVPGSRQAILVEQAETIQRIKASLAVFLK